MAAQLISHLNNQLVVQLQIMEKQKPRFHEKVAKLCILIGKTQWGNGHPDTWSGILIFGGK